ncbi:MAG: hypothetical protein H7252_08900 [Cytophaga sp.]|nr:hypothetical protein [Undibacterium sp.]
MTRMKILAAFLISLFAVLLGACSSPPQIGRTQTQALLNDALFSPPTDNVNVEEVFFVSKEMRQFIAFDIAEQLHIKGLK